MSPDLERIPKSLKIPAQWVCFKHDKTPVNPKTGGNAQADNPATWGTFVQAVKHCEAHKGNEIAGIGFEFSSDDPFTGIDLDKCRNLETGEIDAWAKTIIDRLVSYTEISPSGRGVHILVKGKVPPGGNKKSKVEMYSQARYFTMTGHHLEGTPPTIEPRQAELEALHAEIFGKPQAPPKNIGPNPALELSDRELIEKAKAARNGDKFSRLWRGGMTGHDSPSEATAALLKLLVFWCGPDAGRIDRLFRESGLMRDKWDRAQSGSTWGALEIQKAINNATEFYKAPKAQAKGKSEQKKEATTTGSYSLSDLGNARRLVAQHGQDLHYCHLSKKWWIWTRKVWAMDTTGEVIRRAKLTVAQIYQEAAAAGEKEREAIAKFALRSEHDQRIRGMIRLAESEPGIPVSPGQFDANPWLLNCLNGTVDLKTGKLRPHDRADLITRLAPVEFDPTASCKLLEAFLDRIQKSNQDVISFIQRILGYALTGDCREQCLFLLWGGGANGKSTLLAIISAILGNYAMQTPTETLLAKQKGDIPNDIARLNGPRFVTALEVSQGRRLAESLIKQLTGQDTISARFLFGEYFDFKPQFKLFLGTNHKPVVKDTSHAMWRRLRLIPFPVEIPEAEQDKALPAALLTEAPGILAWMVRGCLSWQHGGLSVPDEVTSATGDYRQEMDVLADFVTECCMEAPGASATAKELYVAYTDWAESNGEKRPLSQRAFGMSLTERGFERGRGTGGKGIWWGIGLKGVVREVSEVTPNPPSSKGILF